MRTIYVAFTAALAVAALTTLAPAQAKVLRFEATLSGKNAVPPNDSKGMGDVKVRLNTKTMMLHWKGDYSGLTGPETMAHFHGPAMPGHAAQPMVPAMAPASPFKGKAKITADEAKVLEEGQMYYNVHTAAHKAGEIAGWLMPAK